MANINRIRSQKVSDDSHKGNLRRKCTFHGFHGPSCRHILLSNSQSCTWRVVNKAGMVASARRDYAILASVQMWWRTWAKKEKLYNDKNNDPGYFFLTGDCFQSQDIDPDLITLFVPFHFDIQATKTVLSLQRSDSWPNEFLNTTFESLNIC